METWYEGTVLWFDQTRGYGFIARESGRDIFVHYTGIAGSGYRMLKQLQRVSFQVEDDPKKGLRAVQVNVIPESPLDPGR
jgi:CspA family cold shock protein